jgi:folate-binding protein YgfZ
MDWWSKFGHHATAEGLRPESFGNSHAEYTWIQTEAVVCDRSDLVWIEVTGRDRAKFLHNFCTQDVRVLVPGQGVEAFVTTVQGKVLAHVHLFAGNDSLWVVTVDSTRERLLSHLDKYRISEDVEFHDASQELTTLFVTGPDADDRLAGLGVAAASLGDHNHFWSDAMRPSDDGSPAGARAHVARLDLLGQAGYLLAIETAHVAAYAERLIASGLHPIGEAAFEAARIEACFPWYGRDITDVNLAQEVHRTRKAISFTKGCYLGQEPIARIDAMGHVNQVLRGVRLKQGPQPEPGAAIFAGGDKPVGRITSATISFADDLPVALAYVRRGNERAGLDVVVAGPTGPLPGTLFWTGPDE